MNLENMSKEEIINAIKNNDEETIKGVSDLNIADYYIEKNVNKYAAHLTVEDMHLPAEFRKNYAYVNNSFWKFEDGVWSEIHEDEIVVDFYEYDGLKISGKDKRLSMSEYKASNALKVLKRKLNVETPDDLFEGYDGIAFKNKGVYDLDGAVVEIDHHPELGQRHQINTEYDPSECCPQFMDFLDTSFGGCEDSEDRKKLLQEYVGATLFGKTRSAQKALMLTGQGGGGKSVFIDVISSLFNDSAISHVSPEDMEKRFKKAALANSRINVVADINKTELLKTGELKQIIAGDEIQVEEKYKDSFSIKPKCGNLFSCNNLPAVSDTSQGFWDRWLMVIFPHNFRGTDQEDTNLKTKLKREMAGIVNWAIDGYKRLKSNNFNFTIPQSSKKRIDSWRSRNNPVEKFIKEECEIIEDHEEGSTPNDLFQSYKIWSQKLQFGSKIGIRTFGKRIRQIDRVDKKRIRIKGSRKYHYNIRLKQ